MKSASARIVTGDLVEVKIMAALIPIRAYKTVQTIGKRIDGGANGGIAISSYRFMFPRVNKAEIIPTHSAERIEITYVFFKKSPLSNSFYA